MPEITWMTYLIVCPLVFLGGFIDSIAGGGGLITLPAYYIAGLPPSLAGGTNKLSAMAGTTVATGQYARRGLVDWPRGLASLLGSLPGAVLGGYLLTLLPEVAVRLGMLLALPLVAALVLKNKDLSVCAALVPAAWTLPACFLIGLLIGVYDGLIGPGTGTFLILAYVVFLGEEALTASGTAKLINLGSNLGGAGHPDRDRSCDLCPGPAGSRFWHHGQPAGRAAGHQERRALYPRIADCGAELAVDQAAGGSDAGHRQADGLVTYGDFVK